MLAGDLLANQEVPDRAGDGRLMYYEHQVQRCERYDGLLADWPIDRARLIFAELMRYTGADHYHDLPLPPAGLPGRLSDKYDSDEPAAELILIGIRYLSAILSKQPRSMHNLWDDARDFMRAIEDRVEDATLERVAAEETQRTRLNLDRQEVYFIGAASGPVKIGIAVNPENRLKNLQTSHHERLDLLATCAGGQERERAYHKRFAAYRLHGEWFERCPEIEEEIARLSTPYRNLSGDGR